MAWQSVLGVQAGQLVAEGHAQGMVEASEEASEAGEVEADSEVWLL